MAQITEWWVISYPSRVYRLWPEGPRVLFQSLIFLLPITFCPPSSQVPNPWTEEPWLAPHWCSPQQPAAGTNAAQRQPLWPLRGGQAPYSVLICYHVRDAFIALNDTERSLPD